MIDAKQAVQSARQFITSLYGDNPTDLALEEIELSDNEEYWLVTLGFTRIYSQPLGHLRSSIMETIANQANNTKQAVREYKIIKVDAEDGEASSMKIRNI